MGKKTGFWLQNEGKLERAPIIGLDTNNRSCTKCLDLGCIELKSKDLGFGVSSVDKVRRDRYGSSILVFRFLSLWPCLYRGVKLLTEAFLKETITRNPFIFFTNEDRQRFCPITIKKSNFSHILK